VTQKTAPLTILFRRFEVILDPETQSRSLTLLRSGTQKRSPLTTRFRRFENIPDPDSQSRSLPLITITDFAGGEVGKEVLLLVAGEHAREIITSEIVLWLASLLTGDKLEALLTADNLEFAEWAATQPIQAAAWRSGWTKGTLSEWGEKLLKTVVFKVATTRSFHFHSSGASTSAGAGD
jgi:hypothetical protein